MKKFLLRFDALVLGSDISQIPRWSQWLNGIFASVVGIAFIVMPFTLDQHAMREGERVMLYIMGSLVLIVGLRYMIALTQPRTTLIPDKKSS